MVSAIFNFNNRRYYYLSNIKKRKKLIKVTVQFNYLVVFFGMKLKALLLLLIMLSTVEAVKSDEDNNDISLYAGTFDILDKEGDDQTTLFGIEHKNPNLYRDTFLGKFKPVSGAFMTGKSSVYLYTGVEGQYGLGPLKILPSFAPGYYKKGDGKDLGSVLEFKSEVKLGFDLFENSQLSYSYSHISNNDWGKTNPGTDNQKLTFSKNF